MSTIVNLSGKNSGKDSLEITKDVINELAKKAAGSLTSKSGELMATVNIKGSGMGYYWSPYEKKLILVPRKAEFYYLPWKKDENGRNYLFLPYYLTGGTVICVDSDEIEWIGFN
tara:strand:+ start:97 stop:438 length:342 start_codon:yes stop_codon:yes gene_type:complete